jgi:hypothetical protein
MKESLDNIGFSMALSPALREPGYRKRINRRITGQNPYRP